MAICDSLTGSYPAPWQGLFYVANPILGKIHAVRGTLSAAGVWSFAKAGDLVTCEDPMFRPIAITFGPDGCLYITDWYNRIISHARWGSETFWIKQFEGKDCLYQSGISFKQKERCAK